MLAMGVEIRLKSEGRLNEYRYPTQKCCKVTHFDLVAFKNMILMIS